MKDILKEEWDIAIILDACRYDSLEKYSKKYLPKGKLEKKEGVIATKRWLLQNFKEYNDLIYISGHPAINSRGIKWDKWDPKDKFYKIIDVWLAGWNDEVDATDPEKMVKESLKSLEKNKDKKHIIHFVQPHSPYRKIKAPKATAGFYGQRKKSILKPVMRRIGFFIERNKLTIYYWRIRKILGVKTKDREEYYWRQYSAKQMKEYYEDNLVWVLESLKKFFKEVDKKKKIIITADHGEAFGEKGEYFHREGNKSEVVKTVPIYSIKKD